MLKLAPVGEYLTCCFAMDGVSLAIKVRSCTFLSECVKGSS